MVEVANHTHLGPSQGQPERTVGRSQSERIRPRSGRSKSMNDAGLEPVMHQCSENGVVAVYVNPGLEIATKVVHLESVKAEYHDRLANEALILKRLRHDNIVSYKSHTQHHNGPLRLIMEYVSGCDLVDYVTVHGAVPVPTLVHIMSQLLSALKYAHTHLIAHGDIKPENVMITNWNHVKLIDFGYAVICDPSMTSFDNVMPLMGMGTPVYSAPEIRMGKLCRYNPLSADVYSVTVTACVLLSGNFDTTENGHYNPNDALDFAPMWLHSLMIEGLSHIPACRPSMSGMLSKFVCHNGKRTM